MNISTPLRMETLPVKIVGRGLTYLDLDTLDIVVSVCVSWSKIITRRHFHPYRATKEYSFGTAGPFLVQTSDYSPSCSEK